MNQHEGQNNYFVDSIVQQLDQCADDFTFPMLDNGYVRLIDARLSAYRDEERWALVIEVLGLDVPAGGEFPAVAVVQ